MYGLFLKKHHIRPEDSINFSMLNINKLAAVHFEYFHLGSTFVSGELQNRIDLLNYITILHLAKP